MQDYVWVGYEKKPPYLPCAVADSAGELARLMGVTENTVRAAWCHYQAGKLPKSRYHKVRILED